MGCGLVLTLNTLEGASRPVGKFPSVSLLRVDYDLLLAEVFANIAFYATIYNMSIVINAADQ
jgi:hypothetical protein